MYGLVCYRTDDFKTRHSMFFLSDIMILWKKINYTAMKEKKLVKKIYFSINRRMQRSGSVHHKHQGTVHHKHHHTVRAPQTVGRGGLR